MTINLNDVAASRKLAKTVCAKISLVVTVSSSLSQFSGVALVAPML